VRVMRLARLLKLARLAKLGHVIATIEDEYDISPSVLQLIKLAFQMCFFAHFLACFWAYMWTSNLESEVQQLSAFETTNNAKDLSSGISWMIGDSSASGNLESKYLAAIYWAFTTMTTVGYGDILAKTDAERLYCCAGMLFGAVTFAYVVGTMSTLVARLESKNTEARDKVRQIKQYCKERDFRKDLADKIVRYFRYKTEYSTSFEEDAILAELSASLREEVIMTVNRHIISKIPIFENQNKAFISYVMSLMKSVLCVPRDYFFHEGEEGTNLYFLVKGTAEVVVDADTEEEKIYRKLKEGDYFGEIAVVMHVPRTASVRGKTVCSAFALAKESLDFMAKYYPSVTESIKKFIEKTQDRFDDKHGSSWETKYDLPETRRDEVKEASQAE